MRAVLVLLGISLADSLRLGGARTCAPPRAALVSPLQQRCAAPLLQEGAPVEPEVVAAPPAAPAAPPPPPSAFIEFIVGVPEPVVPDVKLTRSRDGTTGVATFTFDNPSFLAIGTTELGETTGMYLKDAEGTLKTSEVTATFTNGKPRFVKGVVVLRGAEEWDRFMRFMERYAESNGLGFASA